jgi:peptidoglycan/xylan/chitin deacetylase (PgdA/CDA1 family)
VYDVAASCTSEQMTHPAAARAVEHMVGYVIHRTECRQTQRDDHAMQRSMCGIVLLLTLYSFVSNPFSVARAQPALPIALRVPILMYHYISTNPHWPDDPLRTRLSVPPKQFAAQLGYLSRHGYTTISLDDLVAAFHGATALPSKPVILTFDDGYEDFYTNAYPLLEHYHDQATMYVISQRVDTPGYLSWAQLRKLAASPLITIDAHTRTHSTLTALSAEQSWDELAGSKSDLEAALGISVQHLAYPPGKYNAVTLQQVEQIGFTTAVTTHSRQVQRATQVLMLKRVRVNGGAGLADFILALAGTHRSSIPRARRPRALSAYGRPGAHRVRPAVPPTLDHTVWYLEERVRINDQSSNQAYKFFSLLFAYPKDGRNKLHGPAPSAV